MINISFSNEEYYIINNALFFNLNRIDKIIKEDKDLANKYNNVKESLNNTLSLLNPKEVKEGKSIILSRVNLLDITESLFYKIEDINRLIIRNRTEQYPTNVYESDKQEIVDLYEKLMLLRVV